MTGVDRAMAADYTATGAAWQVGPGRVYDVLAGVVVAETPTSWATRAVLDVGAGTGAATRALLAAGARPLPVDAALGMLRSSGTGAPSTVADAVALPLRARSVDGYVAAFCLNHLRDPAAALREATRVVRDGGPIVASAYADDDTHPVKAAVDAALAEHGWRPPAWAGDVKTLTAPLLATVPAATAVAVDAGLANVAIERREVPYPELGPGDLVAWRLGMAQAAPFVATLSSRERHAVAARALALLGDGPPLARRIIVLRATA